jgi:hypothetical protein
MEVVFLWKREGKRKGNQEGEVNDKI